MSTIQNHTIEPSITSSTSESSLDDPPHSTTSTTLPRDQTELRRLIMEIQSSKSIPQGDKPKRIQALMSAGWTARKAGRSKTNLIADRSDDYSVLTDNDRKVTYHSNGVLGCKHYMRAAKLQGHCCGRWFPCRFCHDEVSDHQIVRNKTVSMMCLRCKFIQPASSACVNTACLKPISAYYCSDCKLWDNDGRKSIYHCKECGICRVGKGLGIDYFHCKTCNVCMAITLEGNHKCIERNLESDCPICGEYMFTSTTMPCGHVIHHKCHQEHILTSYQCPTCSKSIANIYFCKIDQMLSLHTMPPEYADTRSNIYCNDCEKKSERPFHFLYHKCVGCSGYNTLLLNTFKVVREEVRRSIDSGTSEGTLDAAL